MAVGLDRLGGGSRPVVEGYGDGGFRVGGTWWQGPILILPDSVRTWAVRETGAPTAESLAPLFAAATGTELLVLGQGADPAPVEPGLRDALRARGLALEAVATPAACRTFNLLAEEGRPVAAALMPVQPWPT